MIVLNAPRDGKVDLSFTVHRDDFAARCDWCAPRRRVRDARVTGETASRSCPWSASACARMQVLQRGSSRRWRARTRRAHDHDVRDPHFRAHREAALERSVRSLHAHSVSPRRGTESSRDGKLNLASGISSTKSSRRDESH